MTTGSLERLAARLGVPEGQLKALVLAWWLAQDLLLLLEAKGILTPLQVEGLYPPALAALASQLPLEAWAALGALEEGKGG